MGTEIVFIENSANWFDSGGYGLHNNFMIVPPQTEDERESKPHPFMIFPLSHVSFGSSRLDSKNNTLMSIHDHFIITERRKFI